MLENKTIFILSLMKFDGLPSTNYTIAKQLARHNDVYYIDHPLTFKDCWNTRNHDSYKTRKPYLSTSSNGIMETETPGLKIVFTPPVIPINWMPEGWVYDLALRYNEGIIVRRIKKIIEEKKIKNYIFINFFDFHYPNVASMLSPELNIYYCVDPIIVAYDIKHGTKAEHKIVTSSDIIICTSKALFEEKIKINKNTFLVPNAVDLTHVRQTFDKSFPIHPFLEDIRKPVIGYIGNIERRFDFNLFEKVVLANPDKNFVLAGPYHYDEIPAAYHQLDNLFLSGPINYDEMPQMLKGFDVCLIPFKKDEVSKTIFPLKLFEYLGAGKPVIATDFNMDLEEFTEDAVIYCKDSNLFSAAIKAELEGDNDQKKEYRTMIASKNTWESRLTMLSKIIDNF